MELYFYLEKTGPAKTGTACMLLPACTLLLGDIINLLD